MSVQYVDHVFVEGFGATYQHNTLFGTSSGQDGGHFFPHQLMVHTAVMNSVPVPDLPRVAGEGAWRRGTGEGAWRHGTGEGAWRRGAEGIGDGEVPEGPEVVELLLQQYVVLCPAGVHAVDGGVLNVAAHDGTRHLHHGCYTRATGQHPDATKLVGKGQKVALIMPLIMIVEST